MNEELKLSKKAKNILVISIVSIFVLIITVLISVEFINRNTVIGELKNDAIEQGLVDFEISVNGKNSNGDYIVTIICNELVESEYKEIYDIVYNVYSSDADVTLVINGDRYQKGLYKLYKNGETVYNVKSYSSSSSSSHTCEECSNAAIYSYESPFSGEKEWYCYAHYNELQDLLGQFGME